MAQKVIPLSVVDARLDWVRTKIKELSMEENMLTQLRGGAVDSGLPDPARKPTLTDTVIAWVARTPGRTSTEITEGIMADFAARGEQLGGSDPRKTLLTTIGALVTKKRIQRRPDNTHWPM